MSEEYKNDLADSDNMVYEAMPVWGGSWTEEKLEAFTKYVKAYLTIMNRYRDQFNWKLIYFDGFAGSGTRGEKEEITDNLPCLFDTSEIEIFL